MDQVGTLRFPRAVILLLRLAANCLVVPRRHGRRGWLQRAGVCVAVAAVVVYIGILGSADPVQGESRGDYLMPHQAVLIAWRAVFAIPDTATMPAQPLRPVRPVDGSAGGES